MDIPYERCRLQASMTAAGVPAKSCTHRFRGPRPIRCRFHALPTLTVSSASTTAALWREPWYGVRMAERSKALRSGRSPLLWAWVQIPLLTFCLGCVRVSGCGRQRPFMQKGVVRIFWPLFQKLMPVARCSLADVYEAKCKA